MTTIGLTRPQSQESAKLQSQIEATRSSGCYADFKYLHLIFYVEALQTDFFSEGRGDASLFRVGEASRGVVGEAHPAISGLASAWNRDVSLLPSPIHGLVLLVRPAHPAGPAQQERTDRLSYQAAQVAIRN